MHLALIPWAFADARAGSKSDARIAIIAITTSNSIRVNAFRFVDIPSAVIFLHFLSSTKTTVHFLLIAYFLPGGGGGIVKSDRAASKSSNVPVNFLWTIVRRN